MKDVVRHEALLNYVNLDNLSQLLNSDQMLKIKNDIMHRFRIMLDLFNRGKINMNNDHLPLILQFGDKINVPQS